MPARVKGCVTGNRLTFLLLSICIHVLIKEIESPFN